MFFFSSRRRHTRCALVTGVQTCALPIYLPTATEDTLGAEKWGAGPTAVALRQHGPWTYGILANQIWSFAGDDDRSEVNATFLQPFLNYTFPSATTLFLNTETTYDWTAEEASIPRSEEHTSELQSL